MPDCPTVQSRRFGSETRRDETRRDETTRGRRDARHGATRGMWYDEDEARAREEDYDELVRELVHVPDDVRNTVASFLQDLRRDGVDWYYLVGNGDEFGLDFDDFQEERFFRQLAGPCMRATRIPGSASLKFARENGARWDEYTCAFAALYGNLECLKYAHENGCPWDGRRARMPPRMDIWSV